MKILRLNSVRSHFSYIYVLSVITFCVQIPTFTGEDIVNARTNFISGLKLDFWGGTSTLIYGNFPSFGIRWQVGLALLQISMTAFALVSIFGSRSGFGMNKLLELISAYSALLFSSQMTRDGLMFSLLVVGFALLIRAADEKLSLKLFCISMFFIIFSLSFRPWLSAAVLPILFVILRRVRINRVKLFSTTLAIIVLVLPIANEVIISKTLNLKRSFPEQMVMLMDVATSYCYTNNYETGKEAKFALDLFSPKEDLSGDACQLLRPDTWISLTKVDKVSAMSTQSEFSLIQPSELSKFEKLKSSWIKIIISDPVTYLQNRILFAGKLIVGSDSRGLSVFAAETKIDRLASLFRVLYEFAITLHLYSVGAFFFYVLFYPLLRFGKSPQTGLTLDGLRVSLLVAMSLWIFLSSIAYVGSNGRYTYSITLLCLILLARDYNSKSSQPGRRII